MEFWVVLWCYNGISYQTRILFFLFYFEISTWLPLVSQPCCLAWIGPWWVSPVAPPCCLNCPQPASRLRTIKWNSMKSHAVSKASNRTLSSMQDLKKKNPVYCHHNRTLVLLWSSEAKTSTKWTRDVHVSILRFEVWHKVSSPATLVAAHINTSLCCGRHQLLLGARTRQPGQIGSAGASTNNANGFVLAL